jgi:small-conductance mechanosensitive channel
MEHSAVTDFMAHYLPAWAVGPLLFLIVVTAAILLGWAVVKPGTQRLVNRSRVDDHLAKPLSRALMYLFTLIGIALGLVAGGYKDIFSVLGAMMAAGTFAIGFAMKDTIGALIAGVSIFFDKPFKIGDHIEWDDNEGIVTDIRIRTTKVETFDNELLTVPNDKITGAVVRNYSARDKRRESLTFGVSYDADIEQAKYIIHGIVVDVDGVLDDPDPTVKIDELAETPVNVKLRYWITTDGGRSVLDIRDELYRKVKNAFDEEGIDIPYPTYTIDGDSLQVDQQ